LNVGNKQFILKMAFHRGPKIITDGLILNIDGANPKSYPGTGTAWNDLSRNGNNITLVNGPTFDSENGGSILFDRVNDYGSFSELDIPSPWTTEMIFRTNVSTLTNNFRQTLVGNNPFKAGLLRLFVDDSGGLKRTRLILTMKTATNSNRTVNGYVTPYGSNYVDYELQDAFWKDKIFNLTIYTVLDGDPQLRGYYFYLNGEFKVRVNLTLTDNTNLVVSQLALRDLSSERFGGNIYSYKVYNKSLTPQEVVQNWNATKTRFGL
jgi:hypothetical protein